MKQFIIILLFVFPNLIYSQSLSNLNIKYGINKFKLESPYSIQSSNLDYKFGDEVEYYNYTKNDISKILNYNVRQINLGYFNKKLYYIGIVFDTSYHHKDLVHNKLVNLFGKETGYYTNYTTGPIHFNWVYVWETSKVTLQYEEYTSGEINLWMTSRILEKQIENSEF